MRFKAQFRLLGFAAAAGVLVVTLACINRPMKKADPLPNISSVLSIPQSTERDVDILFVIDNSGSMGGEQAMLQSQFTSLMTELKNLTGGLPNVHLGVISTDLGTGQFAYTYCDNPPTGDEGHLLTMGCQYPANAHYIVDVAPDGCEAKPNVDGMCPNYVDGTCTQTNCSREPSTTLVVDPETGCPRCRNYGDQTLEDTFRCIASLGILGCGFEQPLESMYKALDQNNTYNQGFIRESAFLAIIIISDEDDCSASSPQLFDNSQTDMASPLGPATSYRCFEFGITCDVNSRTAQGERHNCVPRDDAGALLYPISRYVEFLRQLKDPQMLVVAAISGPINGGTATVGLNDLQQPELQFSCTTAEDGAVPAFRTHALISAFNTEEDMTWAYTSICSPTFADALEGIGSRIKDILEFQCLPTPLKGCSDVGAEFTVGPRDQCQKNDVCLPSCWVTDIFQRGTTEETQADVVPCLEVCNDGPCPGNTDRNQAYQLGHPQERDPNLPVSACWHINYEENCPGSNYSEIIISRKSDPPPRSFTEVACEQIPQHEQLCNDGVDNDEDCLTDQEDPDCR